jgi:tRNA pseudouridine13 synthase
VRADPDEVLRRLLDLGLADLRDERAAAARDAYLDGRPREAADLLPGAFATERRLLQDLARGRSPAQSVAGIPRHVSRLLVSAYQSALFNRLLTIRMPHIDRLENGDLAWLHDRGAVFSVTDADAEQARCTRFDISPTAPLPGLKSLLADGEPGLRERALLEDEGLLPSSFKVRGAGRFEGERRPLRVPVTEATAEAFVDVGERCLRLRFALPRGSYATTVLDEVRGDDG